MLHPNGDGEELEEDDAEKVPIKEEEKNRFCSISVNGWATLEDLIQPNKEGEKSHVLA